jgi:hypothetical protein
MAQENSPVRIFEILTDIVFQVRKGRPSGNFGIVLTGLLCSLPERLGCLATDLLKYVFRGSFFLTSSAFLRK